MDLFSQLESEPVAPVDVINYQGKVALLKQYATAYYRDDNPIVSDSTYDALFREVAEIESKIPELIDLNSPTQRVGGERLSTLGEVEHAVPMLSLDNAFSDDELVDFFSKIVGPDDQIAAEPKLDGLALSLVYRGGELAYAATRGDGLVGEDVTHCARLIGSIPLALPEGAYPDLLEVRGEVFMRHHIFERLNKQAARERRKPLANCRNAAAGVMRKLDPKEAAKRPLDFYAYSLVRAEGGYRVDATSHSQQLSYLEEIGFPVSPHREVMTIAELPKYVEKLEAARDSLGLDVDGLVFKFNALSRQQELGSRSRVPRWAIARKFPAQQRETVVEEVVWQVGATGAVTPVAKVAPVHVGGVTVTSATLHNMDHIAAMDIAVGDTALCERRGDVVPALSSVMVRPDDRKPITLPDGCPVCSSPLAKEDGQSIYRCTGGARCDAQAVAIMQQYIGRAYLDIDGAGEKLIEQLFEAGMISNIVDLYRLDRDAVAALPGMGAKSADKLMAGLEASKKTTLPRILSGLSIREVGKSASVTLADHFGHDLDRILAASEAELREVELFGPIMAKLAYEGFRDPVNLEILRGLIEVGLTWEVPATRSAEEQPLMGQTWVITGTFAGRSRDDIKAGLTALGAKVSGSISGRTTALAAGEAAGSKKDKALKLGVRVVDEAELNALIGEVA